MPKKKKYSPRAPKKIIKPQPLVWKKIRAAVDNLEPGDWFQLGSGLVGLKCSDKPEMMEVGGKETLYCPILRFSRSMSEEGTGKDLHFVGAGYVESKSVVDKIDVTILLDR